MNKGQVEEQRRVDYVINEIESKEAALLNKSGTLKESVVGLRKTFFDDVTVNLDNSDEIIETHASLKQQAELLSERERSHGIVDKQLKVLDRLKEAPYFGRIDFLEDRESEADHIYIGIASLMDKNDENFLIYDWRAPISSLYYDNQLGTAQFETTSDVISGEILLKRQFVIEQGLISSMFDTGITIGDGLLQRALGNNASQTMKSIVATIQKEQNKIIRDENHKYLIVQGVAGSGKTSAALQRVAYLMYRYRNLLHEDNIVLFSPNPLFNSYVANVLPELGEANMRQTTFLEYVMKKVEKEIDIETPFEQMEFMLARHQSQDDLFRLKSMTYKSSLLYKHVLDDFIDQLLEDGLIFKDISFREDVLISRKEITTYFYELKDVASIPNALLKTQQWLLRQMTTFREREIDEDWVMEEVELLDESEFLEAAYVVQEQEEIDDFYNSGLEEVVLREKVIDRAFEPIESDIRSSMFMDVFATYKTLFDTVDLPTLPEDWTEICKHTMNQLNGCRLNWEDVTPYIYFKERLLGENTDRSVRHLFIDEAQDYTAFQLAYIQHVFPHTRMTFLGDVNQAILAETSKGNPLQADYDETFEKIELTKSYRSTKPIVEFTASFSPSRDKITPFEREGAKPKMVISENEITHEQQLVQTIHELLDKGHETIAIICKTALECEQLGRMLSGMTVHQVNEMTRELEKGVLLVPIYLAKGIEFDAVIIPDASNQAYTTEFDRTLFYTACTRAMHELVLMSIGQQSRFIAEAPKETYIIQRIIE